jgi:D-lactate dehydrogenase
MICSNKLGSGHQAYLTKEALTSIAETTIKNLKDMEATGTCANLVK